MARGGTTGDVGASAVAVRAVATARAAIGTPYKYGGVSPNGFDCSGLCQYSYKVAGLDIPRTSEEQWAAGYMDVPWGKWAPGDLIFSQWPGDGAIPGHVVIYAGNGWTIAAPHTGVTVELEPVDTFSGAPYVGSKRPAPVKGSGTNTGGNPADTTAAPGSSGISGSGGLAAVGIVPVLIVGSIAVLAVIGILIFKSNRGAPTDAGAGE